eukprot:TRINITY_DN21423_c0_g2_i1.p1 TRINITY_DN21423_c0_g2~~TRINITY_DN21423_c0_g2_i1.p1  ORF type:complete len:939 (-),score=133.21 TRINITY_DN21423_c0_g2_i1:214-3030(-)
MKSALSKQLSATRSAFASLVRFGATSIFERPDREHWHPCRRFFDDVFHSFFFEVTLGVVILFNAALVVMETDALADTGTVPPWILTVSDVLLVFYVCEIIGKAYVLRWRFVLHVWNMIDLCVVGLDLVFIIAASHLPDDLPSLATLRLFRTVRIVRAFKAMAIFDELGDLIQGLVGAVKAIFWGTLMIFVMLIIFSIIAVNLLHPLNKKLVSENPNIYDGCDRCQHAFGSVWQSVLTFWQTIVAGDSWGVTSLPIIWAHPFTFVFYMVVQLAVGFTMLNLILAVIVDAGDKARCRQAQNMEATRLSTLELLETRIMELCGDIDVAKSGVISWVNFFKLCNEDKQMMNTLAFLEISESELKSMFELCGSNSGQTADYEKVANTIRDVHKDSSKLAMYFARDAQRELQMLRSDLRMALDVNLRSTQNKSFYHQQEQQQQQPGQRDVQFEPFFVPRHPVIVPQDHDDQFMRLLSHIGLAIFNRQPGRGLAFLVASGSTRDYPIDLVALLRGKTFDLLKIGTFLGEDFSISKILRMEFINSITLLHSGVVAALTKTFSNFAAPPDLQKVDRIIASLAEVWFRQHQRKSLPAAGKKLPNELCGNEAEESRGDEARELEGFDLRRCLTTPFQLHQILFSSVMLHWNLHAPLSTNTERFSLRRWLDLNRRFLENVKGVSPERILMPIFHAIGSKIIPNVLICGPRSSIVDESQLISPLARFTQVEGWVRLLGDSLPTIWTSSSECWQMYSEATASSRRWHSESLQHEHTSKPALETLQSGNSPGGQELPQAPAAVRVTPLTCQRSSGSVETSGRAQDTCAEKSTVRKYPPQPADAVWLSLCKSLLFLSVGPNDSSPFAFVHLGKVSFAGLEPSHSTISLDGGPDGSVDGGRSPLQIVFLLPDGRWQSFEVQQIVVEICDKSQLEAWVLVLSELSSMGPMVDSFTL